MNEIIRWLIDEKKLTPNQDGSVIGSRGKPVGTFNNSGYLTTTCWYKPEERSVTVSLHKVIWIAFNGDTPDGQYVNHINGDKSDNRLTNLEIVTPSGNTLHSIQIGRNKVKERYGERHPRAKLTDNQVKVIKTETGSNASLARKYGVSPATIHNIKKGVRRTFN